MCLETYQIKDPFNVIGPGTMCHNGYFHVDSDKQDVFATHHSSAAGGQHKQNQRGSLDNYNSNDIRFSDFVPVKKADPALLYRIYLITVFLSGCHHQ